MPAAPPISGDVCLSNLEPGPRPPPSLPPSSGLEASKITPVDVNLHSLPADSLSKGPTADPFAAPTKPRSSGSDPILTDLEKNLIAVAIQPSSEMASLTFARRHSRPKRRESPILTRAQRRRVAVSSPPSLRSDLNPITSVVAVPSSPPPLLPLPACKPSSDVIAQVTPSSLLQSTAPSPSQLTPPACLLNSEPALSSPETLHSPSADLSSSPKAALTNSLKT